MTRPVHRILLIALIAVFAGQAADAQQVQYKIKRDDPNNVNNFMLRIDPSYSDLWFTDLTLGYGIGADYMMNRLLDFSFTWRRPYFDMNYSDLNGSSFLGISTGGYDGNFAPKNGFKRYSFMEPIARLHFSDKLVDGSHRLILSQSSSTSGNYTTTTSKFIDVPGKVRKIKSLEGGIQWQSVPVVFEGSLLGPDDISHVFALVNKDDNTDTIAMPAGGGTMMQTATLVAGISFQSINNLKALTDNYGVKYSTLWTNFYVDVLFAPVIGFTALEDTTTSTLYDVKIIDGAYSKNLGWRLGYSFKNTKGTWWYYSMNVGAKPGYVEEPDKVFTNRVFMDFTFGITLSQRIKLIPKKDKTTTTAD